MCVAHGAQLGGCSPLSLFNMKRLPLAIPPAQVEVERIERLPQQAVKPTRELVMSTRVVHKVSPWLPLSLLCTVASPPQLIDSGQCQPYTRQPAAMARSLGAWGRTPWAAQPYTLPPPPPLLSLSLTLTTTVSSVPTPIMATLIPPIYPTSRALSRLPPPPTTHLHHHLHHHQPLHHRRLPPPLRDYEQFERARRALWAVSFTPAVLPLSPAYRPSTIRMLEHRTRHQTRSGRPHRSPLTALNCRRRVQCRRRSNALHRSFRETAPVAARSLIPTTSAPPPTTTTTTTSLVLVYASTPSLLDLTAHACSLQASCRT